MTINYDKPIKDLIDELDKTGHVTHTKYKKTSVTLHHNGGRLSHEGVLSVWKTRPASAHFDVDANARIAQYVRAHEYAWACGNTEGNMRSIHIEMANKTVAPDWEVGEDTWHEAARLTGWLFAHVIEDHPRPSRQNFFVHHHWLNTTCAGPDVDKLFGKILEQAVVWYEHFMSKKPKVETPKNTEPTDKENIQLIQTAVGLRGNQIDGVWGPDTDTAVLTFRKKHLRR